MDQGVLARFPNVLVVEDDAPIRNLLVSALSREELVVHSASDGIEAVNLISSHEYALMLVDFMLPRMSGPEFLRHFRQARPGSTTVILVMTASDDHMIRAIGGNLFHGIIRKPFDLPRLVDTVAEIAKGWQSASHPPRPARHDPWLTC